MHANDRHNIGNMIPEIAPRLSLHGVVFAILFFGPAEAALRF